MSRHLNLACIQTSEKRFHMQNKRKTKLFFNVLFDLDTVYRSVNSDKQTKREKKNGLRADVLIRFLFVRWCITCESKSNRFILCASQDPVNPVGRECSLRERLLVRAKR